MHILHLEDSVADAELIQARLRSQWADCSVTNVNTRESFEAAVVRDDFDLILSDFSLPNYDGLKALEFARGHHCDKPFIYLSGTIGEERAVAALKAGATDYLIKDRPARLVPAITAALAQSEEVMARRRAEQKIREQASLLDKAREAICVIGSDGHVTFWNASAERLYGWTAAESARRSLRELLYAEDLARFDAAYAAVLADGEWHGELLSQPREGEPVLIESFWSRVTDQSGHASILIVDADITAKRKAENQLQQCQRLETLGMLVGGIAHDLNNMLAPIITSVSVLQERAEQPEDVEMLDILSLGARHGADLVRQLLAFARGGGEKRGETDIGLLVGSVCRLLQRAVPMNIKVESSLEGEIWPVQADVTQLRQVLLNLCLNARDAMPDGGRIEISAKGVQVDAGTHSVQGEVAAGPYVRINVADNGTGIPPKLVAKIFDPFFTTKQAGKGTGLGLANVTGIIKSHGGFLGLDTKLGVGTTFHVYLPAMKREASGPDAGSASQPSPQGRGERILVIENNEDIRTVLDLVLGTRGYQVTAAGSGEEGWKSLQASPHPFDLVIADLDMVESGDAGWLRQIRSGENAPKLLVVSDATPAKSMKSAELEGADFLIKPITIEDLLDAVGRAVAVR